MPLASAELFSDMVMKLSVLRYMFKARSKRQLFDLNKQAENFFKTVLNQAYGYELINVNYEHVNAAAIDLGDKAERICIQVTAQDDSGKIKKTIKKFLENKLYEKYDRLVFLMIGGKKSYTTSFDTEDKFDFDKHKDIWDIDDVLEQIEQMELEDSKILADFIGAELFSITKALAPPGSLLVQAENIIDKPPANAKRFFEYLEIEDGREWKREFKSLIEIYQDLASMSMKQRSYLAFIVSRGKIINPGRRLAMHPTEIQSMLNVGGQEAVNLYQVAHDAGFVDLDDDGETGTKIVLWKSLNSGADFFSAVKEFCKTPQNVKRVLVDGDFTFFDA